MRMCSLFGFKSWLSVHQRGVNMYPNYFCQRKEASVVTVGEKYHPWLGLSFHWYVKNPGHIVAHRIGAKRKKERWRLTHDAPSLSVPFPDCDFGHRLSQMSASKRPTLRKSRVGPAPLASTSSWTSQTELLAANGSTHGVEKAPNGVSHSRAKSARTPSSPVKSFPDLTRRGTLVLDPADLAGVDAFQAPTTPDGKISFLPRVNGDPDDSRGKRTHRGDSTIRPPSHGSDDYIVRHSRGASRKGLLVYFVLLAHFDRVSVSFEALHELLTSGADVNATDHLGQTVLHEVARLWDHSIAR